jgi:cytochrome c-type biogenesis protein CcmH
MLLWIFLAILTGVVLLALLRPLFLCADSLGARDDYDLKIYRDQLDELQHDVERGVLGETEAVPLRLEIERRLLNTARRRDDAASAPKAGERTAGITIGIVLCAVPAMALGLYLYLGTPTEPDLPLAARGVDRKLLAHDGSLDMEKARAALQERLAKEPDSLEGWRLLGRTDATLGRWADAKADFAKALELSNRSAEVLSDYGEALVGEAQGTVTPEAAALFTEAVGKSNTAYEARYDLGMAAAQQGDFAKALDGWRALERDAPADAPWLPSLKKSITSLENEATGAPEAPGATAADVTPDTAGPSPADAPMAGAIMKLPPGERLDAIRGMVAGLAARLQDNPNDLSGWQRLGRSYLVLGEPAKSADAYAKAMALAPNDADLALGRAQALRAVAEGDGKSDAPPPLDADTVAAYRKVASLSPDQPEALWYLGLAAKQHGDIAEARTDWQKLLGSMDPAAPEVATVKKQLASLPQVPESTGPAHP